MHQEIEWRAYCLALKDITNDVYYLYSMLNTEIN